MGEAVDESEDEVFVDAHGDTGWEVHAKASFCSNDLNMLWVMVVVRSKVNAVEEELSVVVTGLVVGLEEDMNEDAASVCSSQLTLSLGETADGKSIERDPFCEMDACMMTGELDDLASVCSITSELVESVRYYKFESKETARRISSIWGDTAKKRLIRSLESDVELVYVAQTCLSWEILCYQQKKVEDLSMNASTRRASIQLEHVMIEELQKFRVLVERFTEDERFLDRCRYLEYL